MIKFTELLNSQKKSELSNLAIYLKLAFKERTLFFRLMMQLVASSSITKYPFPTMLPVSFFLVFLSDL